MTETERPEKNKGAEERGATIEALSDKAKAFIEGFTTCADIFGQESEQRKDHDNKHEHTDKK